MITAHIPTEFAAKHSHRDYPKRGYIPTAMGPARRSCIVFYGVLQGNVRNLLCLICARKGVAGAKLNSNW